MTKMASHTTRAIKRWPLLTVVLIAIVLIVVRMLWPALTFDSTSLILFAIAAGALLFCYLPLKRIKMGDLEMELEKLQDDIATARQAYPDNSVLQHDVPAQIAEVLQKGVDNPEGVFLSLCAAMEVKTRERLGEESGRFLSLDEAVRVGVHKRVFPPETIPAFRQFWKLKQQVVHERGFQVDRSVVMSLITSEIDLLKLMSIESSTDASLMRDTPPNTALQPAAARNTSGRG
jgi:hypothetical protein